MMAFLVANLWNFQLNRHFTFRSAEALRLVARVRRRSWPSASAAQLVGLGILTLLMHPGSFLSLPSDVLRQLDRACGRSSTGPS